MIQCDTANENLQSKKSYYYVAMSNVPFEEDQTHEFKGHRDLSWDDISPYCVRNVGNRYRLTHQPISRTLCGFLNSGLGGTVYIGILDDGTAKGVTLTQYQKDHVILALDSVMSRFTPPACSHQYSIEFVPVISKTCKDILSAYNYNPNKHAEMERRKIPHKIETTLKCWCDTDAMAQLKSANIIPPGYVIEISIEPWNKNDHRNQHLINTKMGLHPIYENEEGYAFFRHQASLVKYDTNEVKEITAQEVKRYYMDRIERLQQELKTAVDDKSEL